MAKLTKAQLDTLEIMAARGAYIRFDATRLDVTPILGGPAPIGVIKRLRRATVIALASANLIDGKKIFPNVYEYSLTEAGRAALQAQGEGEKDG